MKKKLRETHGATMVESAIYFPLIILCIMFAVYMLINLYTESAFIAHMHMDVRRESGVQSGCSDSSVSGGRIDRYRLEAESKQVEFKTKKGLADSSVEVSGNISYRGGRLLGGQKKRIKYYGRSYIINEKTLIF